MSGDQEADAVQDFKARAIAVEAVRTVPDLDSEHLFGFLDSIDRQEPAPSTDYEGVPIWRYMLDADTPADISPFPAADMTPALEANHIIVSAGHIGVCCRAGGRAMVVVAPVDIIGATMRNAGLDTPSPAETRLAALLLAGHSLSEAAEIDGVAYETRRNQFKSLSNRMRLSRQQDVVRVLLQDILLALMPAIASSREDDFLHDYADRFLPEGVRVSILNQRKGPPVRILDYGPLAGRPVIVLHPMIFPDITAQNLAFAVENNARVIFPLRPGVLELEAPRQDHMSHHSEALAGVETAWTQMCGVPTPLVAMVSSGALATAFARKHPEKTSSVTYAATCFSAGHYRPSAAYFGASVAELALRNETLLTKTMAMLKRQFAPRERFEPTIKRIFAGSAPDMAVLDREFDAPHQGARIMEAVLNSETSLRQDYFNQVHFDWEQVKALQTPVRFVHGDQDTIHPPKDMRRLHALAGAPPKTEVAGVGHLFQYERFDELLGDVLTQ
ncbi:alpha/beta hydrolase [Oricola sp.]|uniref:alpha/beta fold hydrolase n=1 Tax=Oricola sp. TaxID=1979950 RepID=UPI0025D94D96|nr:alpha/beta hydrolase [Oricola sp.]MCI5078221.1 alpha/beta hydrolase [Oricola sp.]